MATEKTFGDGCSEVKVIESNLHPGKMVVFTRDDNYRIGMGTKEAKKHLQCLKEEVEALTEAIKYAKENSK